MNKDDILQYINEKYHTKPNFLWTKFPEYAVFRHNENTKWYALFMVVPKQKLGIPGDGSVEILNVKCHPVLISSLLDGKSFFPAYHMNKEHWITVLLDNSISPDEVFNLIDLSYDMTKDS